MSVLVSGEPAGATSPSAVVGVDVAIVSFHCRDLVLDTIAAALASTGGLDVRVVVADNDSADGTVREIRRRHTDVTVLEMGSNTGFAHACNAAAAAGTARYVLVLNPDAVLEPGALRTMVDFALGRPDVGVVAPGLRNPDGSDQLTARAFPTPAAAIFGRRSPLTRWFPNNRWSSRFLAGRGRADGGPFEVDWVSGAAMLVPRAVLEEVGGLDEGFFLFWEDADWCRRIGAAGYHVWCVPSAVVTHDEGGTRSHGWSSDTIRWFHQGAYRYWRKHHAPSPWNPARWLAAAALTLRATALILRYDRPGFRASNDDRAEVTDHG